MRIATLPQRARVILPVLLIIVSLLGANLDRRFQEISTAMILKRNEEFNSSTLLEPGGLIISNLLGRMGNNIFEIAFARQLAHELRWPVVYRIMWQGGLLKDYNKTRLCFPHAISPNDTQLSVNEAFRVEFNMTENVAASIANTNMTPRDARYSNIEYNAWKAQQKTNIFQCPNNPDCFLDNVTRLAQTIRDSQSRVVSLEDFFVSYEWIDRPKLREVFEIHPSCCRTPSPTTDTVVIHIRNFGEEIAFASKKWNETVYVDIIQKYGYELRPIWIVCEPRTVDSVLVERLQVLYPGNSTQVLVGEDPIDAFCILHQAKILILSASSTFSQTAALLSPADKESIIHYPTWRNPKVTLFVPEWKYHIVEEEVGDLRRQSIVEFETPRHNLFSSEKKK